MTTATAKSGRRATDGADFARQFEPFRRELLAHSYRMLGSLTDAEDLVQETYLRAWRAYGGFEGRASLRSWLYRIATNACLTALAQRERRPLPSGLAGPGDEPDGAAETTWLQPMPDALVTSDADDPATVVATRESIRLALVASLQYLPPRQRAVLILREVLGWPAAEIAALLETSTAAVKSMLQRARARLGQVAPVPDGVTEPTDAQARAVLDRYVAAFENSDAAALEDLLRQDAVLEMPPSAVWFAGGEALATAISGLGSPGEWAMVPTTANGQPAAAAYRRDAEGVHRAYGIVVLTTTATHIARIVVFGNPDLFPAFGLPELLSPAR
jgi:RNA polymerase sigma-70 factor (ECF subfamily)